MKNKFGFNWAAFGLNPPKIDGFDTMWVRKEHVGKKPGWEVANDYKIPKGCEHLMLMKRKK